MQKFLLFMLGVLTALPGIARDFSYTYEGQTVIYTVIDEDAKTCKTKEGFDGWPGNLASGVLVIPSIAKDGDDEFTVKEIGDSSFCNIGLTSVTIPSSVETIMPRAFEKCSDLKDFTVEDGEMTLTLWDSSLKYSPIERLYMGRNWYVDGNKSITTGITSVEIGNSVTALPSCAFYGCSGLTTITIPNSVTYIGEEAFSGCSGLTTITIPNSVTTIEDYVFDGCSGLTTITIPNSVTTIGMGAFFRCSGLTTITIPNSVTYINKGAFAGCSGLTTITIPNSVTYIGDNAFAGCSGLTTITIPNSVTYIGIGAFGGCTNLFSALLLMKQCNIRDNVFPPETRKIACYKPVTDFFTNKDMVIWTIEDDETVDAEKGIIWAANGSDCWVFENYSGELRIPDGMTTLTWSCFSMCPGITEVFLPNTLEEIGVDAFYGTTIKEIVIPNRVTTINEGAFNNCNPVKIACPDAVEISLDESASTTIVKYDAFDSKIIDNFVYSRSGDVLYYAPLSISDKYIVPENVTSITDKAFAYCEHLTEIVLPEKLEKLGENVWVGCNDIKTVVCKNPIPVESPANLFTSKVYDTATLYVPKGCKSAYANTVPWKYFSNISDEEYNGVDNIMSDENNDIDFSAPVEVYNLQGVMIGENTENLTPGIYIVRQGNKVKKIAVK